MKLNAIIIDDEPLAHDIIKEYLNDVSFIELVGEFYLASEALSLLKEQKVDLIFLDINMPKIKGLEFLRIIDHKPIVIITSAYQEYALESFELDVSDYLLKPFRFNRFLKAVNKALDLYKLKNSQNSNNENIQKEDENQFFIKVDKKLIQVNIDDIFYLESYGNYVKIWMEDTFYLTPRTLSSFENQFNSNSFFFRIHKSYIVSKLHIDYLEGNLLIMKNKKELPVGKNHKHIFKSFLS